MYDTLPGHFPLLFFTQSLLIDLSLALVDTSLPHKDRLLNNTVLTQVEIGCTSSKQTTQCHRLVQTLRNGYGHQHPNNQKNQNYWKATRIIDKMQLTG